MRKIFFFLLLLAGWAVIFWPIYSDDLARSGYIFSGARPSNKPLPPAWQNQQRVLVSSQESGGAAGFPVTSSASPGGCSGTYIIQRDETLGEIARDCDLTLKEILAANPRIPNPDRVYPGQQIILPDHQAGRGGAEADSGSVAGEPAAAPGAGLLPDVTFRPGVEVRIDTAGLPPNTTVRIGLGLSSSGYTVVGHAQSDAQGHISASLTLPANAVPGDTAFIMVSTLGTPSIQRMSETFKISEE